MRASFVFALSLLCFSPLAMSTGHVLVDSYGVKTWRFLHIRYIESLSHLYGEAGRKFEFSKVASGKGQPDIRVFTSTSAASVDTDDLQSRTNAVYAYLGELTGEVLPVREISIYLVPCGYDYDHVRRSISTGAGLRMDFAFAVGDGDRCHQGGTDISRKIVRTLAHESLHTVLNFHHPDQTLNERVAVTVESCAELVAFGDTSFAKRVALSKVDPEDPDSPLNVSLQAKYGDDRELEDVSAYGPVSVADKDRANRLLSLCATRYKDALRSGH
jgi:hypothetical protein